MGIQAEPSSMRGSPRAPGTGAWRTDRTGDAPDWRVTDEKWIGRKNKEPSNTSRHSNQKANRTIYATAAGKTIALPERSRLLPFRKILSYPPDNQRQFQGFYHPSDILQKTS